jgi:hypothetical protein
MVEFKEVYEDSSTRETQREKRLILLQEAQREILTNSTSRTEYKRRRTSITGAMTLRALSLEEYAASRPRKMSKR